MFIVIRTIITARKGQNDRQKKKMTTIYKILSATANHYARDLCCVFSRASSSVAIVDLRQSLLILFIFRALKAIKSLNHQIIQEYRKRKVQLLVPELFQGGRFKRSLFICPAGPSFTNRAWQQNRFTYRKKVI